MGRARQNPLEYRSLLCHNCGMTTVWRVRIEEDTLARADKVTKKIGTSTQEAVRIFVKKIAETGRIPLELDSNYDDLVLDKTRRNKLLASLDDSEGW